MICRTVASDDAACKGWPWPDAGEGPWDHGGLFGKSGTMEVQPRGHERLRILGEAVPIVPLPRDEMEVPGGEGRAMANASMLDDLMSMHAPPSQWLEVARLARSQTAKIVAMGCSTSSGCGCSEPWQLWKLPRNVTVGRKCIAEKSWARRALDALEQLKQRHGLGFEMSVHFKNAVRADHWAFCTSSYVPDDTSIVLLEVATNVWGHEVDGLLSRVRECAPNAAIVFVNWAGQKEDHDIIHKAASQFGADVIHVPNFVPWLVAKREYKSHLFALRGIDKAHPSPQGHALIGALVARFVGRRLLDVLCNGHSEMSEVPALGFSGPKRRRIRNATLDERCWTRADTLLEDAQTNNGSWALVDHGGDKGVRKLGLLSTRIGDVLDLRPWPAVGCMALSVQIGYLVSATMPNLGGFRISCPVCQCVKKPSVYEKLFPFPEVQTNAMYNDDTNFATGNMTVTAVTEFVVMQKDPLQREPCTIRIMHIAASATKVRTHYRRSVPSPQYPQGVSQIRIDTMTATSWSVTKQDGLDRFDYMRRKAAGSVRLSLATLKQCMVNQTREGPRKSASVSGVVRPGRQPEE